MSDFTIIIAYGEAKKGMYKAVIGKSSMPSNRECGILVIVEINKSRFNVYVKQKGTDNEFI